jgi:ATP-binding cassette, subfamily B, bacterial MsbA
MLKDRTFRFFYDFTKSHWSLAAIAMVFASLISIMEVISTSLVLPLTQVLGHNQVSISIQSSKFIEKIINSYTYFPEKWQLLSILLSLLFITILKNISLYLSNISINSFMLKGGTLIRQRCIERFLELEVPFYTNASLGELLSYVNEQAQRSEQLFSRYLEILRESSTVALLLWFLIILSPTLTLVTVASLVIVIFSLGFINKKIQIHSSKAASTIENFSSLITEIITGIRVVKSFDAESRELKNAEKSLHNRYKAELTAFKFYSIVRPLTETIGISVLLIILLVGTTILSNSGSATLGILITYTLTLLRILPRVNHLNGLRSDIYLLRGNFETIENFLSSTATLSLQNGNQEYRGLKSELKFENLTFTYPNNSEETLRQLNFTVKKGTTVAIVGSSGSGKSTLVDLLMRFYDPDAGSIRVDGVNLQDLQISSWRKAIAMVSQDTFLFNASIRENISYGRPNASESQIIEAAKSAYAYEFIQDLPTGFDTIVGNRGSRLSGGQRQRIAIARAILCNPDVLILDEATSALDSKSERIVQLAIEQVSCDRTVIAIAHRLSTIEKADQIIVLQDGKIVEQGTHQDLLALKGSYYLLSQSQTFSSDSIQPTAH